RSERKRAVSLGLSLPTSAVVLGGSAVRALVALVLLGVLFLLVFLGRFLFVDVARAFEAHRGEVRVVGRGVCRHAGFALAFAPGDFGFCRDAAVFAGVVEVDQVVFV